MNMVLNNMIAVPTNKIIIHVSKIASFVVSFIIIKEGGILTVKLINGSRLLNYRTNLLPPSIININIFFKR